MSGTFENWQKRQASMTQNTYLMKLPKLSRNAKKLITLSKVLLIRAHLNMVVDME